MATRERVLVHSQSIVLTEGHASRIYLVTHTHNWTIFVPHPGPTENPLRVSQSVSQSVTTIIATTSHHQRAPPGLNDDNTRVVCTRELQCYGSLCMVNKPEYNQFHRATNDNSGEQPRGKVAPNPACETVADKDAIHWPQGNLIE